MTKGCSTRYASYIDKLLTGDLSRRKMSKLRGHLAGCESCQARYNRVVLASRLLEGGPAALALPAQRELDWLEPVVLERARLVPDNEPARRSMLLRIAAPAITIAAVLAVGLPILLRSTPPTTAPIGDQPVATPAQRGALPPAKEAEVDPETFAARGTNDKMSTRVGLRAFCIHREETAAQPSIIGLVPASATAPPASCQVQDIMRFAYTNRSKLGFLFLLGLDDKYEIKWYEPHPPQQTSVAVTHNTVDKPLPRAVRLNVNHGEGQLRLFAVFSGRPLQAAQIKKAVAKVREAKTPLNRLQVLPLEETEQRSLLLKLSP
jgi:hypothetical protein